MGLRSCSRVATLALLLTSSFPRHGLAQEVARDESRTDYQIQASLQAAERTLTGSLVLTWTNRSGAAAEDLWFHLYHNAFSNNRSTHLQESGGRLRGHKMTEGWGWQRVTSLRIAGQEKVSDLRIETPPESRPEDRTVFSIPLETPVADGDTIEVEIDWEARIPRVRRRTGYKDNFFLMAHWFPKLGVFEGERGWNCHPFHANTEFYADYGQYDVSLDLPLEYREKVAASGKQYGAPVVSGNRVQLRFVAPSLGDQSQVDDRGRRPLVHGFAWSADPDFYVREGTFQYEEWEQRYLAEVNGTAAALGVGKDELRLRDVTVRIFLQPERAEQWERHFDATCTALFFYGLWYGGYPYEKVSVIDPPWGGRAAGGMEYPTLFTCGTALFTKPQMMRPEGVTVHEAGHQFWYGLVGNNEFETAWLDEGLNSYTDSEALFRRYGPRRSATSYARLYQWGVRPAPVPGGSSLADALSGQRLKLPYIPAALRPLDVSDFIAWWRDMPRLTFVEEYSDTRWNDRRGYLSDPASDPIEMGGSWKYVDSTSYRTNSYPRPAAVLRSLSAVIGRDAFQRGMRKFADDWRFRHPYPDDFYAAFLEENPGIDWYFEDLFRGTGTIDWSVDVRQPAQAEPIGLFPNEAGEYVETEVAEGDDAQPTGSPASEEDESSSTASEAADPPAEEEAEEASEGNPPSEEPDDSAVETEQPVQEEAELGESEGLPEPDPLPEPGEAPAEEEASADESDEPRLLYDVVVRARGELSLPLVIEVTFEDGEELLFQWTREAQQQQRWWRLPLEPGTRRIQSVVLDPERLYYIDTDMSNNQWYDEGDPVVPLRWAERLWTQYSHLLYWHSTIGG